jgi:hypothetical protein
MPAAGRVVDSEGENDGGETMSDDLVTRLRRAVPIDNEIAMDAADEIERNRATMETQATLISDMRGEIGQLKVELVAASESLRLAEAESNRLNALAIRAWHSFRSGLTAGGGCDCGLTDADILEMVRLANEHPPA